MKLGELKQGPRGIRGVEILTGEDQKPSLNEQIRLDKKTKDYLWSQLEIGMRSDNFNLGQGYIAVNLVVLFPEEWEAIMAEAPIGPLVEIAELEPATTEKKAKAAEATYMLRHLSPEEIPKNFWKTESVKQFINTFSDKLWAATMLVGIYPEKRQEIIKEIQNELKGIEVVCINAESIKDNLQNIHRAIQVDPSRQPVFHEYALKHKNQLSALMRDVLQRSETKVAVVLSHWLAGYKLPMAEQVKEGPNGIIIADEKPALRQRPDLPERSMVG